MCSFQTPILFIIFNRPEKTKVVFEEIKKQQPKYLFIAADGRRPGNENDALLCSQCREIVAEIEWDCEIKTLYRESNLGCGVAPADAITWFFGFVDRGIILEDDILTDSSFFDYCEKMLEFYKNEPTVMHISGGYFLAPFIENTDQASYYFTKHIHVWGWATWRRAWQYYNYDLKSQLKKRTRKGLKAYYADYYFFWTDIFETLAQKKRNDIWDYQWMFAISSRNGIAINPAKNLTKNIGFGSNATHTFDSDSNFTTIGLSSISELIHPSCKAVDNKKDILYYQNYLKIDLLAEKAKRNLLWKLKKHLRNLKRKLALYSN